MQENGRHSARGDGVLFIYSKGIRVREEFYKTRIQDVSQIVSDIMGIDNSATSIGVLNPSLIQASNSGDVIKR